MRLGLDHYFNFCPRFNHSTCRLFHTGVYGIYFTRPKKSTTCGYKLENLQWVKTVSFHLIKHFDLQAITKEKARWDMTTSITSKVEKV